MIQALLIAAWAGICSIDDVSTQILRRPLLTGTVAGMIMGDVGEGLLIGATLELMWMGIGSVGAYVAPDMITGAIVGIALAIKSGGGVAAGIALAVPVSILCQQLLVLFRTLCCGFNAVADKAAEEGDFDKIIKIHTFLPILIIFLLRAVPSFAAVYFGGEAIEAVVASLPANIINGLGAAGKIIPAVGISVLLLMMLKGRTWVFLVLGFTLATFLGLSILPIAFIALAFALLYDLALSGKTTQTGQDEELNTEGGMDL